MNDKPTQVAALLTPTVQSLGLTLLGVEYLPTPGAAVLRLYIDVPSTDVPAGDAPANDAPASDARDDATAALDSGIRTVGIEDCEAVSREVSALLDVEDLISGHYTLEVSSPGVDRPLFTPAQFARFIGQQAKVGLKLPQDGRRKLRGTIVAANADEGSIAFLVDGRSVQVAFANIDKARLVPDWAALGFAPAKDKAGRDARPGKQSKKAASRADKHAGKQG